MPYERQLKVMQVYDNLFLGIQIMKHDVNLKFRLIECCNAIHRIRFHRIA